MSKAEKFDVLGTMRAVREDDNLTAAQKALLWAATLRTNNGDGKVRASLETLAEDAKFHRRTAERAFAPDQSEALKYFDRVERSKRRVDLWFRMEPSTTQSRTHETDTESHSPVFTEPSTTQSRTRNPDRESQSEPSATSCPPSATGSRTECDTVSHHLPPSTTTSTGKQADPLADVWAEAERRLANAKASKTGPNGTPLAPGADSATSSADDKPDPWAEAEPNARQATGDESSVACSQMPPSCDGDTEVTAERPTSLWDTGTVDGLPSFAAKDTRRRARLAERESQSPAVYKSRFAAHW